MGKLLLFSGHQFWFVRWSSIYGTHSLLESLRPCHWRCILSQYGADLLSVLKKFQSIHSCSRICLG